VVSFVISLFVRYSGICFVRSIFRSLVRYLFS